MKSVGFLLIHGAGLGAWAWEGVIPRLQAPAMAVDLPRRGDHTPALAALHLEDYVQSVVETIAKFTVEKMVLVGHSIGGEIALRVATRMPERVAGIVFVSAVIPKPGKAMLSIRPWLQQIVMRLALRYGGPKPPEKLIRAGVCNGLNEDLCAKVLKNYSPESPSLFLDPVHWTLFDAMPRWYVKTLRDMSVPAPLQDRLLERVRPSRVPTLDCGHFPMLAKPEELANILNAFIQEISNA